MPTRTDDKPLARSGGVLAVLAVAVTLLGAGADAAAAGAEDVLRIGMVAPISGPLAKLGQETVIGSQIAADMVNEQGGVSGRTVALVVADTPTPDEAKSAVERLVTGEKLKVILGDYGSSLAIAASTTAVRYGAFYWEQSSASYDITRLAAPYSVKSTWGNGELTERLLDVLRNVIAPRLGKPVGELHVAFIHEDSGWGSELAQFLDAAAKRGEIRLDFVQAYNAARTSDFTPMILRLKQQAPDVLLAASYLGDAIKFQQQSKDQDFNVKAMIGFTAGFGISDFATTLGHAADDILVIDSNPQVNPQGLTPEARHLSDDFVARFRAKTGKQPASHAIYAFLGSYALLHYVLPKVPTLDRDEILKQALAMELPFGSLPMGFGLHFTADSAPRPRYNDRGLTVLNQWQHGQFVTVYPAQFATGTIQDLPLPPWTSR